MTSDSKSLSLDAAKGQGEKLYVRFEVSRRLSWSILAFTDCEAVCFAR